VSIQPNVEPNSYSDPENTPDLTLGAQGYNMRASDTLSPNRNFNPALPVLLQYGPFNNSAPSVGLPATGIYINIYGYGYGTYRAPTQ